MIPDDVEKIIMTKEDYDRNVEQLLLDKCKAELEVERLSKQLENLEKLNNANYQSFIETNKIIIELEKWIKGILLSKAYSIGYKEAYKDIYAKLQELKGDDKE